MTEQCDRNRFGIAVLTFCFWKDSMNHSDENDDTSCTRNAQHKIQTMNRDEDHTAQENLNLNFELNFENFTNETAKSFETF